MLAANVITRHIAYDTLLRFSQQMKPFLAILLFISSLTSLAQVTGNYYNLFGSRITLNTDSTFNYQWNFDLVSSWNTGKWQSKNDTIYLEQVIVYDTLKIKDKNEILRDSLVLSLDQRGEAITPTDYVAYKLVSGGQGKHGMPTKLFYRKDKLFELTNESKPLKKKVKGFMTSKKVIPWYRRVNDI